MAEGDVEEQSEVPKKKQKVSKKVQTRVYFYERIIRLHISLFECLNAIVIGTLMIVLLLLSINKQY